MTYPDPLRLIPEHFIEELSEDTIKQVRKELLLRFELHQNTTIDINGQSYDKNTVIQTFDELKKNLDFHLRLYHNILLYQFITIGKTAFFERRGAWYDFEDQAFEEWLKPYFVYQYDNIIYQILKNEKGVRKGDLLQEILKSSFQLPTSYQAIAFVKPYQYLRDYFAEAMERYEQPYTNNRYTKLKSGIEKYIENVYVRIFDILPPYFAPLANQYRQFLKNILNFAFYKERYFNEFDKQSLELILKAAKICNRLLYDKKIADCIYDISTYINTAPKRKTQQNLIYLPILLFKLGLIIWFLGRTQPKKRPRSLNSNYRKEYYDKDAFRAASEEEKKRLLGTFKGLEYLFDQKYRVELTFSASSQGKRVIYFTNKGKKDCWIEQDFRWELKSNSKQKSIDHFIYLKFGELPIKKHLCDTIDFLNISNEVLQAKRVIPGHQSDHYKRIKLEGYNY